MKEKDRIVLVMKEGSEQRLGGLHQIYVDRKTGVQYLYIATATGAGLTPLIDENGKPMLAELIED